ncbi:hypothetical protein [Nocardia pseudovaccinii]|uniref:hypothetical protein n=1 Tax=Nocardia pseudovaccinii TaxID=189540 RepID=UPI0007A38257|nr:hypothetical protein [Nocardia pseudovaccinii]
MTDIELPDWERTLNEWDFLPSLDEDTIGDVDYLTARLRHALDDAARQGAICRARNDLPHADDMADSIEAYWLRDAIGKLVTELATHTRTGADMFAMLRRRYLDMSWTRERDGFMGTVHLFSLTPDPAAVCARGLRLPEIEPMKSGARRWRGRLEGLQVTVCDTSIPRELYITAEQAQWVLSCGPELPRISWRQNGYITGGRNAVLAGWISEVLAPDLAERAAIAQHWTTALNLTEQPARGDGVRRYAGETDIGLVQLSCVADPDRWNASYDEARTRLAVSQ